MDWFLQAEKKYRWNSNRADWFLVRFCMLALGLMTGVMIQKKAKKPVFIVALLSFVGTFVPVAYKYFKVAFDKTKIY